MATSRNTLPEDIFLIQGGMHDEPTWYYVRVPKPRQPMLKKAMQEGAVQPEKFGAVIFYGFGLEPPAYYREKIANGDLEA